ncbi:putative Nudix hydrolase [Pullulanibacillus camelliae]|uniref:Putative Nudix hydrolase n=1 Tax=Pullulanibacillus camelliae TaxID=1707096 RepID=A0A8J2YGQ1_9BACL|nr:NUDIX hydrolase [Pullulanibacillus camelliae]GGE40401.1 putative Nudix hydrolase [Pullulanibacillus camelliae]
MDLERLKIFQETGESIGSATRGEVHQKGLWHETFHCWFVGKEAGKPVIYLQQRSTHKEDFPCLLDITAAGHLLAHESVADGVREIGEELGISISFEELISLGTIKNRIEQPCIKDNEFCHSYLYDSTDTVLSFHVQQAEVEGLYKADFDAFYKLCMDADYPLMLTTVPVQGEDKKVRQRKVTRKDFVPHDPDFLATVASRINQYFAGL